MVNTEGKNQSNLFLDNLEKTEKKNSFNKKISKLDELMVSANLINKNFKDEKILPNN
jgi:hypothetical protein